jgi:hypothetical protein
MNFFRERTLSKQASDLVEFDADSLRQVASSQHVANLDVWLADPDAYEKDGRILRDTETARMLAYSKKDHVLYATDGCNSCSRRVDLPSANLDEFAESNGLRKELLERLFSLL